MALPGGSAPLAGQCSLPQQSEVLTKRSRHQTCLVVARSHPVGHVSCAFLCPFPICVSSLYCIPLEPSASYSLSKYMTECYIWPVKQAILSTTQFYTLNSQKLERKTWIIQNVVIRKYFLTYGPTQLKTVERPYSPLAQCNVTYISFNHIICYIYYYLLTLHSC